MTNTNVNMKKFLAFVAAALFSAMTLQAVAQEETGVVDTTEPHFMVPDYQKIERESQNKKSQWYFDKLAVRVAVGDTTLTTEDLQMFYFGQSYRKGFSQYASPAQLDEIRKILNEKESLTKADAKKIIDLADDGIKKEPANPQLYYYKLLGTYVLASKYGESEEPYWQTRLQLNMLLHAMGSTGNGMDQEHAIHVVRVSHEYFMMNLENIEPLQQSLIFGDDGTPYDLFKAIAHNPGNEEESAELETEVDTMEIWFNITRVWAKTTEWNLGGDKKSKKDKGKGAVKEIEEMPLALIKEGTEVAMAFGSQFDIEIVKLNDKKSKMKIVEIKPYNDTLVGTDALQKTEVKPGHIVGYFCYYKMSESSDWVQRCLVCKPNTSVGALGYESFIMTERIPQWTPTSNDGMFNGAVGVEMWSDKLTAIKISNLRSIK